MPAGVQYKTSAAVIQVLLLVALANTVAPSFADSDSTSGARSQVEDGNASPADPAPEEDVEVFLRSIDDLVPDRLTALTTSWYGDLDGMVARRVIRTLVLSGGPQFFYYDGRPRGMIAELLGILQKEINVTLDRGLDQVEILPMPVSRDRLIPALLEGEADLIAADLTITDYRSAMVDFSDPLVRNVDEIVVFAPGEGRWIASVEDLSNHTVYVQRSSSYFEHLRELNEDLVGRGLNPIRIQEANELLRPQDMLDMVNAAMVPATVIDGYKATYWSKVFREMEVREDLVISTGGVIAWAFRKDSPQLAALINDFVHEHRQGTLIGNVLINRYMENLDWVRRSTSQEGIERLRPLMEHFKSSAAEYGLDPFMIAAQAYQESELRHDRKSAAGAVGIMQVKPSTAADQQVGIPDISNPADNIRAGSKYMRFLMDHYFSEPGIGSTHQWLFALAAYNAGPAKIQSIRRQAAAEGHDPNLWLENVELVAARRIGRETVRYVRNVYKYYVAYRMAWEDHTLRQSLDAAAAR